MEEIAYENGWITREQLMESAERYGKSPYGQHLKGLADGEIMLVPNQKNWVIGQNVCPFWLVFLCGSGRSSCSSCMGGELEVGQNVCPEWPVRPCGTTVE